MEDIPLGQNKSAFDQLPIGKTNKVMLDQYPPDYNPQNIQTKKQPLPLAKRLQSKIWKVKKQALQQLLTIIKQSNHKQFQENQQLILKSISDSNVQCQFLAIKILFNYLQKEGKYQGQAKTILKNINEKIMTIQKDQIRNEGMQIICWLFDHGNQEMIMNQLNQYLLNKNPKIVASTIHVIKFLLNGYGHKKLGGLDTFCKHFKIMAEIVRPVAKPQAIQLFKQVYKWIGQSSLTGMFSIHPQVKEQVQKWAKTYQMQPMQIKRGLKKGQQGKRLNPMQEEEQDSTPVDVLPHYDSRWVDIILAIEKWKQKKQQLDEFIKKTKVNCIVPRDTTHYITLLKRLFQQNNINLLQCGFKIMKNLCKGLKKSFSITCKSVLSYLYLKLKDNKAMIVDQTLATLKSMTYSISLQDMESQLRAGLKDKAPQMRLNSLKLLKQFCNKNQSPLKMKKILKSLLQIIIQLNNDGTQQVRDIALSVLCKMKELYGMLFFQEKLQGMNQKKINQIKATVQINQGNGNDQGINQGQKMEIEQSYNYNNQNNLKGVNKNTGVVNNGKKKLQKDNNNGNISNGSYNTQNSTSNPNTLNILNNNKINLNNKNQINQKQTPIMNNSIYSIKKDLAPITLQTMKKNRMQKANAMKDQYINISNQQQQNIINRNPQNLVNQNIMMNDYRYKMRQLEEQKQKQQVLYEQWPVNPTPNQVFRLMSLFIKLGGIYTQLATPYKLQIYHIQLLQNKLTEQISLNPHNATLIFKWSLWKIMVQDTKICQKLMLIVYQIIQIININMTNQQMLLVMSIVFNSLEHERLSLGFLGTANRQVMNISSGFRDKVLSFWLSTLNQQSNVNIPLSQKIIQLIKQTFYSIPFKSDQICSLARLQIIFKSPSFISFLLQKGYTRQFLKVCGYKSLDQTQMILQKQKEELLLNSGGSECMINVSLQQKNLILDIFKKNSTQLMDDILYLQKQCGQFQVVGFHLKIIDTIMLPYLRYSIQSINVYHYFRYLTNKLGMLCGVQHGYGEKISPHLRNLMRLLIFFLIDLNSSKLDNKDEVSKIINKILLVLLDNMAAQHLNDVLIIIADYAITNNLSTKLFHLLTKCITKTIKSNTFAFNSQKIITNLYGFFIRLIENENLMEKVSEELKNAIYRSVRVIVIQIFCVYRDVSYKVLTQKILMNYENCNTFKQLKNVQIHKTICDFLRNYELGNRINSNKQVQMKQTQEKNENVNVNFNNSNNHNQQQFTNIQSNIKNQPQRMQQIFAHRTPNFSNPQNYTQNNTSNNSNKKITQMTNLPSKNVDQNFLSNQNHKINNINNLYNENIPLNIIQSQPTITTITTGERKRFQNMQQLVSSLQELQQMRDNNRRMNNNTNNMINNNNNTGNVQANTLGQMNTQNVNGQQNI